MNPRKPRQPLANHTIAQMNSKNAGKIFAKAKQTIMVKPKLDIMASLPNNLIMKIIKDADGGINTHKSKYSKVMNEFKTKINAYKSKDQYFEGLYNEEFENDTSFECREMGVEPWIPSQLWYNGTSRVEAPQIELKHNPPHELNVEFISWFEELEPEDCTPERVNWIHRVYNMDFVNIYA